MFTSLRIRRGERVVHVLDGEVQGVYPPGLRTIWTFAGVHEFHHVGTGLPARALTPGDLLPADTPGTRILDVRPDERVAVLVEGRCVQVLEPGRWRWWNENGEPTLLRMERGAPPAPLPPDDPLPHTLEGATIVASAHGSLLLRQGSPYAAVPAGTYRLWTGDGWALTNLPNGFVTPTLDAGPRPGQIVEVVAEHERVSVFRHGAYLQSLRGGRHVAWEATGPYTTHRVDVREPPAPLPDDDPLPPGDRDGWWQVASGHEGLAVVLVRDGQPEAVLPAGRYRAWTGSRWSLKGVPLSLQSLDVAPQDLLTADEVPVRVKPAVTVRARDPLLVLREPDWPNQVYLAVQLALREVVTARTLEALLTERETLGAEIVTRARELLPAQTGMQLETAAVKDVILPGEVKELLNRVTLARKEAEALSIKRREETAATRQLANTARLLENNPVLLRLKELEALGEIAGRIERITLVGDGGGLVKTVLLSDLADAKGGDGKGGSGKASATPPGPTAE